MRDCNCNLNFEAKIIGKKAANEKCCSIKRQKNIIHVLSFNCNHFFFFQSFYLRFFPILYTLNVVCVLTKFDFLS